MNTRAIVSSRHTPIKPHLSPLVPVLNLPNPPLLGPEATHLLDTATSAPVSTPSPFGVARTARDAALVDHFSCRCIRRLPQKDGKLDTAPGNLRLTLAEKEFSSDLRDRDGLLTLRNRSTGDRALWSMVSCG